jgi:hypothetical protein
MTRASGLALAQGRALPDRGKIRVAARRQMSAFTICIRPVRRCGRAEPVTERQTAGLALQAASQPIRSAKETMIPSGPRT